MKKLLALLICITLTAALAVSTTAAYVVTADAQPIGSSIQVKVNVNGGTDNHFSINEQQPVAEKILWEPGYTQVIKLEILSGADTASTFYYRMVMTSDTTDFADLTRIENAVDVYCMKVDNTQLSLLTRSELLNPDNRIGTLADVLSQKVPLAQGEAENVAADASVATYVIALKMQESAGNAYQGKASCEFKIVTMATATKDDLTGN